MSINDVIEIYEELSSVRLMMSNTYVSKDAKSQFVIKKLDDRLVKLRKELDEFDQWCSEEAERQYNGM